MGDTPYQDATTQPSAPVEKDSKKKKKKKKGKIIYFYIVLTA
jgi:hypothetical protein